MIKIDEIELKPLKEGGTYIVKFKDGVWIGESNEGDEFGYYICAIGMVRKQMLIIGNQYDNPELGY